MRTAQFSPINIAGLASSIPADAWWHAAIEDACRGLPGGQHAFWGIPFELAPEDSDARWVWLGAGQPRVSVDAGHELATHIVVAHFTAPSPATRDQGSPDGRPTGVPTDAGEVAAEYRLVYPDGDSHMQPIRRRFEVNDVLVAWGQLAFASRPHRAVRPLEWRGPHARAEWGYNQTAAELPDYEGIGSDPARPILGTYWIYALPNPEPDRPVMAIELAARGGGHMAVGGITLFRGTGDPLRHERLVTVRVDLASPRALSVHASVDLGVIARRHVQGSLDTTTWVDSVDAGLGSAPSAPDPSRLYLDVVASEAATLVLDDATCTVAGLREGPSEAPGSGITRIELVDEPKAVLAGEVLDASTGRPTPVRIHFSTLDGRYLPPYGHRREVNTAWFEDYGADLLLGDTSYAYIDGRFQIEVPVGEVLVEVVKGFEYEPVRRRLSVEAGQQSLALEIARAADAPTGDWVSADTHVHFVSPETAWLMGQAEGVNVVNLLAAQWGELFTNIADYTGELSGVSRGTTLVWVGTENRQHLLGHLSLLGKQGSMAAPLSAGGPNESYLGDPVWTGLSGWADEARAHGGVAIVPHFPTPDGEITAGIIQGKFDGVELRDFRHGVDSPAVRAWYRYLNSGFRVPTVGGTDKMSAAMPIGGVRTYARIGQADLTFASWADAVRGGRTVTSSGPILDLEVEGESVGSEVRVTRGGGRVSVRATGFCLQGIGSIEIVHDGVVVAREEPAVAARSLSIEATVNVRGPGWIAARCEGPAIAWHCWPVRMAAHTSPVYIHVGGDDIPSIDPADRAYFASLIEGGVTWLDTLATPAGTGEQARIRTVFEDARATLAGRRGRAD